MIAIMRTTNWLLPCLLSALLLVQPRAAAEQIESAGSQAAPATEEFQSQWQDYLDSVELEALQRDCRPRMIPADARVQRRGAVVMLHGFSGCPQQYFTLAQLIAASGFDVLLPVHPGHGRLDLEDREDLDQLPQVDDETNRYAEHAKRMNQIMAASPGDKVIVGFSLGGATALQADLTAPDLYARMLLLSPMLAVRGGSFVEGLIRTFGHAPGLRNLVVKPLAVRNECDGWEQAGRAGFCDYRLKDVLALVDLEALNRELWQAEPSSTPIQIIASGDEKYVSNPRIEKFVRSLQAHGPIAACIMPEDVPHELLSPYENTERQMYWLGDLLNGTRAFIESGIFMPSLGDDQDPLPRCRLSSS